MNTEYVQKPAFRLINTLFCLVTANSFNYLYS
jgi:hypothetical protein